MIFVFAKDDLGLDVFQTADEAIQECEGVDVEDGNYLFWDADGNALSAVFTEPNQRTDSWVLSGQYQLVPSPKDAGLLDTLDQVAYLEGRGIFASIDDVRRHLEPDS